MIAINLKYILKEIPTETKLVAVSKTRPISDIIEAYTVGQKIFGENKVQELVDKHEKLPKDIEWHFIGHLQTNKVKFIAPFVSLIHSIDSLKLLKIVNSEASKHSRTIDCLLQFHVASEMTKFGLSKNDAIAILESDEFKNFSNVRIVGVMGMATYTEDQVLVSQEFKQIHSLFSFLKNKYFQDKDSFCEISMGMSHDYKIAIQEGSTMIRLGSSIFGSL